jgi:hypothetical protein
LYFVKELKLVGQQKKNNSQTWWIT